MLKAFFCDNSLKAIIPQSPLYKSLDQTNILFFYLASNDTKKNLLETLSSARLKESECVALVASDLALDAVSDTSITVIGYQPPTINGTYLRCDVIYEDLSFLDYSCLEEEYNRAHNLPVTILETKRLLVRELAQSDMASLFELYQESSHIKYIDPMESFEVECEKLKAYQKQVYQFYRFGLWGVFLYDTNTLIGRCGLQCIELDGETHIELGYFIGLSYCQQGYAFEVCSAIIQYARENLELTSIVALIREENNASLVLIKKLGFHFEKSLFNRNDTYLLYRIDF